MKPYAHYSVEELALDDLFVQWVRQPDDEEVDAFWQGFLLQHPHSSDTVYEARALVQTASVSLPARLSGDDVSSVWGRIRESLQDMEDVRPLQPEVRSVVAWWYLIRGVAASVGIVLLIGWAVWMQYEETMCTVHTDSQAGRQVVLPDGSRVYLYRDSQLRFARQWCDETPRSVWLEGKADFAVAHKKRPTAINTFRVHTADLTIEAHGTTFKVAQGQTGTHIALTSGQVDLLLMTHLAPVSLCPGDSVAVSGGIVKNLGFLPGH